MTPHSSTLEHPMASSSSSSVCNFLKNLFPWVAVLIPFLIYTCISAYGFSSIFITSLVMLFSTTFFLNFSKQKQVLVEEPLKAHPELTCSGQSQVEETEKVAKNSTKESQENMILNLLVNGSPDSYSESEVVEQYSSASEEDSDIDWPFPGNVDPSSDCSDGSISDEESLIEIALPSGHYLGSKEDEVEVEEPKWGFQQKCRSDFSPEAIFGQRSLKELLAEINDTYDMNEEENLIEIDISMGSIKCSRFEIEA